MTDPTIATVDDEPWNQSPTDLRRKALADRRAAFVYKTPETVPIESALSIAERVSRRIPIMTPAGHAEYVYAHDGHTKAPECCWSCEAKCILSCWTEYLYAPKDPIAKRNRRDYVVARDIHLCNTCSNKLRALPLGEKWNGKR